MENNSVNSDTDSERKSSYTPIKNNYFTALYSLETLRNILVTLSHITITGRMNKSRRPMRYHSITSRDGSSLHVVRSDPQKTDTYDAGAKTRHLAFQFNSGVFLAVLNSCATPQAEVRRMSCNYTLGVISWSVRGYWKRKARDKYT
jgi:hypothetical protein